MTEPYGPAAKAAFDRANALVKEGKYEAALSVEMLPSDLELIKERIERLMAASANTTKERT